MDPSGKNDCGELKPVEGCYCRDGYVLNSNGICVMQNDCGCKLADGSLILAVICDIFKLWIFI